MPTPTELTDWRLVSYTASPLILVYGQRVQQEMSKKSTAVRIIVPETWKNGEVLNIIKMKETWNEIVAIYDGTSVDVAIKHVMSSQSSVSIKSRRGEQGEINGESWGSVHRGATVVHQVRPRRSWRFIVLMDKQWFSWPKATIVAWAVLLAALPKTRTLLVTCSCALESLILCWYVSTLWM